MKKTITLLLAIFSLSIATVSAQVKETFFRPHMGATYTYEAGHRDIEERGTAKLVSEKGGIFVLECTTYKLDGNYEATGAPRSFRKFISFTDGDGTYEMRIGETRKEGKIGPGALNFGAESGWVMFKMPKEFVAEHKLALEKMPGHKPAPKKPAAEETYRHIQNVWKNTYLNIENGVAVNDIGKGAWSGQWVFEPCEGYYKIKNRWKGTYLHIEGGMEVQCSEIQPGWHSAMWTVEKIPGSHDVRIKNRWKGTYLNIEHGSLHCTDIQPGWDSAKWRTLKVQ